MQGLRVTTVTAAALIAAGVLSSAVPAQSGPRPRQGSVWQEFERYTLGYTNPGSQLKDHVYERSRRLFDAGDAARDALSTPDAIRARQDELRRKLIDSLGGLPASDAPLNARVTGTTAGQGFRVEKVVYESRPHHYVTANLYLPDGRQGRTPAVLFLCGHSDVAKAYPFYQGVCQAMVRAGLIVLAIDPVGQGERLSYFDQSTPQGAPLIGTRDHDTAGSQLRFIGQGIARYFLHDAMRAIDYLVTRPEIDASRIGVTGNSGGGTQTSLVMMVDRRIAAAAPATFIMAREPYQRTGQPQDAEQIWSGFTRDGFDHEDILLSMAPKPVRVLAVTSDFFPIEGTRRTVTRSRRLWRVFGSEEALDHVEDASTHGYTLPLARAAAEFFSRHLLGREVNLAGFIPQPFPAAQLQVTTSGQVRTDYPDAEFVYDAMAAEAAGLAKQRAGLSPEERRRRAIGWLRGQVMRDRHDVPLNPRWIERGKSAGTYTVDVAFWWSQPNLANLGMLIRPAAKVGSAMPVTVAVWDGGTAALSKHEQWIAAETSRGRAVFVVNLAGVGPLKPDIISRGVMDGFYGTWHKLSDDLDWIGDSLVALRTYEAMRAVDVLKTWPELQREDVRFHGQGRMGVHAKLAAAIDDRIRACEWQEPFRFSEYVRTRFYDTQDVKQFVLPDVLRHFDLDEL